LCKCTGDPGFTDTGGTGDQQVEVFFDPLALRQIQYQGFVQPAGLLEVDVFDAGILFGRNRDRFIYSGILF
jgi:hypothetical protein